MELALSRESLPICNFCIILTANAAVVKLLTSLLGKIEKYSLALVHKKGSLCLTVT